MFQLSATATYLSQKTNIEQQIILEIEGIPFLYGAIDVAKLWRIGDPEGFIGLEGLKVGGVVTEDESRPYISLTGTTNNITQQIEIDSGGTGSIQKFVVELLDKQNELTKVFQPDNYVEDILGTEARVYLNFKGGAHPDDSIQIFSGLIEQTESGAGFWKLSIAHPDELKKRDLLTSFNTKLNGAITNSVTTIFLDSVSGLILPQDVLKSYVRIDDEIIEYTSKNDTLNTISGCTRGALGTIASAHDDESDVETYYTLEENALELALKLMLSRDDDEGPWVDNVPCSSFVNMGSGQSDVIDGVLFPNSILQQTYGMVKGDFITITGASNGANNVSSYAISEIFTNENGTVLVLGGAGLVSEIESNAVASFKSKYDTLPDGCNFNMTPRQVDVEQHEFIRDTFSSNQLPYFFKIDDTIDGKLFITEQIYKPAGFYQVPRKGKASVNMNNPPLVLEALPELTESNVRDASKLRLKRSVNKNHYNLIAYKFNPDVLDTSKYLTGEVVFSARSASRIKTGVKSLQIDADGIQDDQTSRNFVQAQARRFVDRYRYAPEQVQVKVQYSTGFSIEVADIVLFGSKGLQLADQASGDRDFTPRLMEVSNKSMNIKTGDISLTLLDTGFGLDGNYGTISPSSLIDVGSTTSKLFLKKSFGTGEFELERSKWENFVGENITVRNDDFTFSETVTLLQFSGDSIKALDITPALSLTPNENYIIELPPYPISADKKFSSKQKQLHVNLMAQVVIVSGISNTQFTVAPADINVFSVGSSVRVHNDTFSVDSTPNPVDDDAEITDITGTTITVNKSLGFTPLNGYLADLGTFADNGLPYRLI